MSAQKKTSLNETLQNFIAEGQDTCLLPYLNEALDTADFNTSQKDVEDIVTAMDTVVTHATGENGNCNLRKNLYEMLSKQVESVKKNQAHHYIVNSTHSSIGVLKCYMN